MKCKACKRRMRLKKEDKYLVIVNPGLADILQGKTDIFEAFDCSKCGCQNIIGVRETHIVTDLTECESEFAEEE